MSMRRAVYKAAGIAVLAVSVVVIAGRGQSPARPPVEVGEDEYQVFSAYIAGTFTGQRGKERVGDGISRIVIVNTTRSDEPLPDDDNGKPISWKNLSKSLRKEAPTLNPTTIDAFRKVNLQQAPLRSSFHLPLGYELVDSTQIDSIFKNGGWWTDYYRKYPGSQGVLTLSRVGFSADGTQALFYASNSCGGKCGNGNYVVMEKRGSNWVIAREILIWVS